MLGQEFQERLEEALSVLGTEIVLFSGKARFEFM